MGPCAGGDGQVGSSWYDIFISYAHSDDSQGWNSDLRDAIVADHSRFTTSQLAVFLDQRELHGMDH